MKNTLILLAIVSLAIITASVASYYLIILPRQNIQSQEDINAIRNVIAPTPEQQKTRQIQYQQEQARLNKVLSDYNTCQLNMSEKASAYLGQQCPSPLASAMANPGINPFDPVAISENNKCIARVMESPEYKKFACPKPF